MLYAVRPLSISCLPFPDCTGFIDLVLVLDVSGSIERERLPMIKEFIANLLRNYSIFPNVTRVGAIYFSDNASAAFNLNSYTEKQVHALVNWTVSNLLVLLWCRQKFILSICRRSLQPETISNRIFGQNASGLSYETICANKLLPKTRRKRKYKHIVAAFLMFHFVSYLIYLYHGVMICTKWKRNRNRNLKSYANNAK